MVIGVLRFAIRLQAAVLIMGINLKNLKVEELDQFMV